MSSKDELFQKAIAQHQAGQIEGATQLYRAVLAEDPRHADAVHMLGVIARQNGNTELALKLTETALALKPDLALAWYNRSLLLRSLGRSDDALYSVQQSLLYDDLLGDALDMAGTLLREKGQLEAAAVHHAKAVALQPDNMRYRSNQAIVLMAQGDLVGAYEAVRHSERLDVDSLSFALGNVLRAAGYPEKSIPHYSRVSRLMPNSGEALMNEAMARLQIGELDEAWEIWKRVPEKKDLLPSIPAWRGENIHHLLLHEEQGMGDALQCVRYIALIKDRAQHITLQLNGALQSLMQFNFPDINVITLEDKTPIVDARAELMSLPALLRTNLKTIPSVIPYLQCDEQHRVFWCSRLADIPRPRIGFCWAGNPNHRNNKNRSLELQHLAALFEIANTHAVSLQKWRQKDVAGLAAFALYDADPFLNDFAATAGLIMELDLVITVDTSVAHLAGALGKPFWVLIPFDPDWRWMLGRTDSPWYPTARLFRQTMPGDWTTALTALGHELQKFVDGDRSVLKPELWVGPPLRQNPFALQLDIKPSS